MNTIPRSNRLQWLRMACVCVGLSCGTSVNGQTAALSFASPTGQAAIVELYTSEGCSSCPRGEAWLSRLKTSPRLWTEFVPVAFHVDYWDYLGWRDPFGRKAFSDRQRAYAANWRSDSIYTPGFILNGREWPDWSRAAEPAGQPRKPAGILRVTNAGTNHWQVEFTPTASTPTDYEVHAAILGMGLSSDVKAGENLGQKLMHDFVVLDLVASRIAGSGETKRGDFHLPLPKDVARENLALALWVTERGKLEPLQATGGWLNRQPKQP